MPETFVIPKETSSFPAYLDFFLLREKGIEHIEKLGSDLWTDYNLHDPGITILEVLLYALTDLGYRTNFPDKDLFARSQEEKNEAEKTIFQLPADDNFFTAAESLSCNPVTIADLRKLLLDLPGVKNAWFVRAPEGECPIFLNKKERVLQFEVPPAGDAEKDRMRLRGLYDVCVELEPLLQNDACGRVFFSEDKILDEVRQALHAHRNLCEDIREIIVFGKEQIAVCADVELASAADPEDVLLEIYKRVEEFLSPTLRFYTLQEMLERGKRVEEIFEGRPFTAKSNGFLDLEDLKKLDPRQELYTSDIYRLIMDIPGVLAVRNLSLANFINGVAFTQGERWCLHLTPKYRPHFELDFANFTFFKGLLPFSVGDLGKKEVRQRYLEEKAANQKAYLDPYQLDLPIPEGKRRNLEDYVSILEEFPLTYGVGSDGIKSELTQKRRGQAKQLQGYLLFFDQLLANYLSQLAHVRDLFSIRPDEHESRLETRHSYFVHLLNEVPNAAALIKNLKACTGNDDDPLPPEDYAAYLAYIAESLEGYRERRNRFLDHLLARFAESFSDYVLLMFNLNGKRQDAVRILQDKADFLQNYPETSRNRGKAMDCTHEPSWGKDASVSGLEKRVSKLIGLDDATRRSLSRGLLLRSAPGWGWELKSGEKILLKSNLVWGEKEEAEDACDQLQQLLTSEENFRRLTFDVAGNKEYSIEIKDLNAEPPSDPICCGAESAAPDALMVVAEGQERFPSQARFCEAVEEYVEFFDGLNDADFKALFAVPNGDWFIQNASDENLFLGKIATPTTDEDFAKWRVYLTNPKHYCRKDHEVEHNNEYGFFLADENGNCFAEGSVRYASEQEREAAIHELITRVVMPGLTCETEPEDDCFYFELFDYKDEKLLLRSEEGFKTNQETLDFFDKTGSEEDVKGWGVKLDNYEKTSQGSDSHSFYLEDNSENKVALHLGNDLLERSYATEQERNDRLQAIIYYLDDVPPTYKIEPEDGATGDFQFEIKDAAGNLLFQGTEHYLTQLESQIAAGVARQLARHLVQYRATPDDLNDPLPYSFELLDKSNPAKVIATHPNRYATASQRDRAIDVLRFGSQNLQPVHRVVEDPSGFYFELMKPEPQEDEPMMRSAILYDTAEDAEDAWLDFLEAGLVKANFMLVPTPGPESLFAFTLQDSQGNPLANSSITYEDEPEAELAMQSVINYLQHTEWIFTVTGTPGKYRYKLLGKWHTPIPATATDEVRILYESFAEYPDSPSALAAYQQFLELAKEESNHVVLPGCKLELRDNAGDGSLVATHPWTYANQEETVAARDLILAYVRQDALVVKATNTGGAFQAAVLGENGAPGFVGAAIFNNQEEAELSAAHLLELAAEPGNYVPLDGEPTAPCAFSFALKDPAASDAIVASHPKHYRTEAERDAAMLALFSWLTSAGKLQEEVIREKDYFTFLLEKQGETLLVGKADFDSEAKAEVAFDSFLPFASQPGFYKNKDNQAAGEFGFYVENSQHLEIAAPETPFATEAERDEARQKTLLFAALRGAPYTLSESGGDWRFSLQDAGGNDFLVQTNPAADEATAQTALLNAFNWAQSALFYRPLDNATAGEWSFELMDLEDETFASHPVNYASPEARDAAQATFIEYLKNLELMPATKVARTAYFFEFEDFAGNILLRSSEEYDSEQAAKDAWVLLESIVQNPANFAVQYNNAQCQYLVKILWQDPEPTLPPQPIAFSPQSFTSRTAANAWIDLITNILIDNHPQTATPGTECGYFFTLTHAGTGTKLNGTQHYPTPAAALQACNHLKDLLLNNDAFKAEQVNGEWRLVLKDGDELLAISEGTFAGDAEANAARETIQTDLQPAELTGICELVFRERMLHCALEHEPGMDKDCDEVFAQRVQGCGETQSNVLLKSLEGTPFSFWGQADRQWESRAFTEEKIAEAIAFFTDFQGSAPTIPADELSYQEDLGDFKIVSAGIFQNTEKAQASRNDLYKNGKDEKNYRLLQTPGECSYSFEIIDDAVEAEAWENCNHLLEQAQEEDQYSYVTNEQDCLFGFELTDPDGLPLASHSWFYPNETLLPKAIHCVEQTAGSEGMHLVEHLLLRPRRKGLPPLFTWELKDEAGKILVQSANAEGFATKKEAEDAFILAWKSLFNSDYPAGSFPANGFIRPVDNLPAPCKFGFEVWDAATGGNLVAVSPGGCATEEERIKCLGKIPPILDGQQEPPADIVAKSVKNLRFLTDSEQDNLLPPVGDCACAEDSPYPCTDLNDPYSFRATVVLPYWSERFQNNAFRAFLETTLRQEAPAHVLLRICWVDACQMREFETAYRRWLESKAKGEQACDASFALNDLIDVLFNLKNIYPAGTLHDCAEPSGTGNEIVLNFSIIGSAKTA